MQLLSFVSLAVLASQAHAATSDELTGGHAEIENIDRPISGSGFDLLMRHSPTWFKEMRPPRKGDHWKLARRQESSENQDLTRDHAEIEHVERPVNLGGFADLMRFPPKWFKEMRLPKKGENWKLARRQELSENQDLTGDHTEIENVERWGPGFGGLMRHAPPSLRLMRWPKPGEWDVGGGGRLARRQETSENQDLTGDHTEIEQVDRFGEGEDDIVTHEEPTEN